jgi:hypothetical protein
MMSTPGRISQVWNKKALIFTFYHGGAANILDWFMPQFQDSPGIREGRESRARP